ncbi:hypothetical protein CPAST_c08930 [Clostridium pasteurianum DSM 525 = ATCC 6013]|uniref:Uncharacterized protein n=1 Tax=Clostridium pasteurianum DSM 525 = ATCC 6013 TaxID=1262449 RepID=A0A0H3J4W6_CLOPA|nr:hypothetical protein [Clostridium pasteurianum]AJA46993.1 hypothetical protein CPAST_c08930 [Clostridium pasteurianum DSM 525 = ATCC 6013]AJA50981.1 hypothetical protein CLPA_c08930 [Clostridium pasteurianum DSM 525 = ATCC 6013]AOZ74370.1 hypothetical protein AQ983_04330 [Clostridium pasteurianum DSM 525 = ATCC 6013]AOZ78168.1 hypothetical protein AQ984_04335 [Clostridium pasteurianum]ELP58244.1 hypothetical protein F502_16120 [Clostridium pasteurianum DSM 525 = ATCC 6013]
MSDKLSITAMVCVTLVALVLGVVGIFAILAYLKDKASLKLKTKAKTLVNNEVAIDIEDTQKK